LILLPSAIPALAEPLFGLLVDKIGVRTVSVASFSLLTPCLVGLGFADNNTFRSKVLLLVLLSLVGVFSDATEPAMVVEGTTQLNILENESSEESEAQELFGAMISLQTSSYFVGLLFGPVLGGFITIAAGWRVMCWTLALLSGVTAGFSLGLGGPRGRS
jgi:MFS family permease